MKVPVAYLITVVLATGTQAASLHRRASGSSSEVYYIAYCFSTEQYSYTGTEIDYYQNKSNGQEPDDIAPVPSALFNLGADNPGASLNATFQDSGITVAVEIPLVSLYAYISGISSNFSDTGLSVGSLTRYPDLSSWNCVADNFSTVYYTSSTSCQSFAHCIPSNSSSSNSSSSSSCGW